MKLLLWSVPCLFLVFFVHPTPTHCWTDEDLELFDLVESTDRNFYSILGVDEKASSSDIRKAYRRLSQLYHPDKNKEANAEETFRKIAAISDVLRNEEQRKKYDVILKTGLPDWREPIYYYRRVRNMGLLDLTIFLLILSTIGQYLFAWSSYWEKKYEIEETVLSKLKKKAKQNKKRGVKTVEEIDPSTLEYCNIPKPRCQDLFPVQFVFLLIHCVTSMPSYLKLGFECISSLYRKEEIDEDESDSEDYIETKIRTKKHVKPQYPDLSNGGSYSEEQGSENSQYKNSNGTSREATEKPKECKISEFDLSEFKKGLKKFPNGTLQRYEKIAEYLNCAVPYVLRMAKHVKSQQITRNVPIAAQGLTGVQDNLDSIKLNGRLEISALKSGYENGFHHNINGNNLSNQNWNYELENCNNNALQMTDKCWKQEEQKLLEVALQKFPKETLSRWDRISDYVMTKTKEECILRYKELAQQIKKKKDKES